MFRKLPQAFPDGALTNWELQAVQIVRFTAVYWIVDQTDTKMRVARPAFCKTYELYAAAIVHFPFFSLSKA